MINYEDFYEQLWDYVSGKIVDDHYFFQHEDMMRAITKDLYDIYTAEEARIHPKYYARAVESFFFNLFKDAEKNPKTEIDYNIDFE